MSIIINGMTFLKLLLSCYLIFFVTTTIVAGENLEDNQIHYHSPLNIIALHYEIKIRLPMTFENYTFNGESNINIIVRHPTQEISLHSVFVEVNKTATLIHEISRRVYKSSNYSCHYGLFICTYHFYDLITIGSYLLKVKYYGTISDRENADGFIITSYMGGERDRKWTYSAGDFQNTVGVQYVFPSVNELVFKATFNITVYYPKTYIALSNMPATTRKNINTDVTKANFQTTPAMHPHLVAIIISDLGALYTVNENVPLWCRDFKMAEQLNFALNVAEATTMYLEDKYFQDKKLNAIPKTDHVAIPYHRDDGLPNWGIVFYSEESISYNNEWNSIERKTEVASLIARKVAHQFLSKVTLSSWSDLWLNEGLAMVLGMHAIDKIFTDLHMMDLFVVRTRYESLHLESATNTTPVVLKIKEPYEIRSFSTFRYKKAFAIFRMLYHILSDEVFRKSIYNYLNNQTDHIGNIEELERSSNIAVALETLYQCCCNLLCCVSNEPVKPTSADSLWAVMQTVLNEPNHKNKFNIKKLMDFWITYNQYPILKVTRNYRDGRTIIWSEMRNMSKRHEWWIPVTYTTQTNPNFNITWPFFHEWINSEKFFVYLPSINRNDWIIVNLQQLGYYRVMYDKENWIRLAKYLHSNEYKKIHVVNRAQIIDDAYHFLIKKQLDFDMYKELTGYLSQETDYIAWYPMFKTFRYLFNHSNIFSHPEAAAMKEHMQNIVYNLLEKIGYVNQFGDNIHIISLREEAAEWACFFGVETCRKTAYKELQNYITLATNHKVSSKKWVICGALMITNTTNTWNEMYNLSNKVSDNVMLEYLPCVKQPAVISEHLKIIKSKSKISDNNYNNIFFSAIAHHANNDEMLSSILANFEAVKPKNLNFLDIIKRIIKYMYTEKQFQMIINYVKNKHGHLILDVKREIEDHMSETKNVLDCFQNSKNTKSLEYSMQFDYIDIIEMLELIC